MLSSRLILLLPLLGVGGCLSFPGSLTAELPYRCENGMRFTVSFERAANAATITHLGERLLLAGVPSASGAKYSDGKTTLFTKGHTATLDREGLPPVTDCKQVAPGT